MSDEIPYGYCHCGCGEKTKLAPRTNACKGHRKGEPKKWLHGHNARVKWAAVEDYKVNADGCWVWQRNLSHGYGVALRDGVEKRAHRVYYEEHKGPIPEGLVLDHLCRNPPCVNPDHLEAVTQAENCRRGNQAKLTWEIVAEIRRSPLSQRAEGRRWGVGGPTICNIRNNRRWVI